jgi:hypothetical protein
MIPERRPRAIARDMLRPFMLRNEPPATPSDAEARAKLAWLPPAVAASAGLA